MSPKSWFLSRLCVFLPLGAVVVMAAWGTIASGYPEPALVARAWQLDAGFQKPDTIAVRGVDGKIHHYWFMAYKVVNHTKTEHFFVPEFTIATDKGDIITANRGISPHVFSAIKKRLVSRLLESPVQVTGRLLIGPDFAKESVAIWPAFDHDVDEVSVFVAGLSGETQPIRHLRTGKVTTLRKTLMLQYRTPGTTPAPGSPGSSRKAPVQTINLHDKTWVMR